LIVQQGDTGVRPEIDSRPSNPNHQKIAFKFEKISQSALLDAEKTMKNFK
jgi:hypothetical protein